jgi:hypothetical protein
VGDSISSVTLSGLSGSVTLWSDGCRMEDTLSETRVQIAPSRPVVIGRAEGREVPYLDPAYLPTRLVPGTGQTVMLTGGQGADIHVSRGHFMLRAHPDGVLFVNGVPRRGGGIRPPLCGTWLLSPARRKLEPGEEYLIAWSATAVVWLPNGSQIQIEAG